MALSAIFGFISLALLLVSILGGSWLPQGFIERYKTRLDIFALIFALAHPLAISESASFTLAAALGGSLVLVVMLLIIPLQVWEKGIIPPRVMRMTTYAIFFAAVIHIMTATQRPATLAVTIAMSTVAVISGIHERKRVLALKHAKEHLPLD